MNKKRSKTNKQNKVQNDSHYIDYEKITQSIIKATKQLEKEKYDSQKTIVKWIQIILNGLMFFLIMVFAVLGIVYGRLLIGNIKNGSIFSWINIILFSIVVTMVVLGVYTFITNNYIEKENDISNLTGIGGFVLSILAVFIAVLALMLQVQG